MERAVLKTLGGSAESPENICLNLNCNRTALRGERLCALCFYMLPRETRQALALQDEFTEERDRRLVIYLTAGQPLEHIHV